MNRREGGREGGMEEWRKDTNLCTQCVHFWGGGGGGVNTRKKVDKKRRETKRKIISTPKRNERKRKAATCETPELSRLSSHHQFFIVALIYTHSLPPSLPPSLLQLLHRRVDRCPHHRLRRPPLGPQLKLLYPLRDQHLSSLDKWTSSLACLC